MSGRAQDPEEWPRPNSNLAHSKADVTFCRRAEAAGLYGGLWVPLAQLLATKWGALNVPHESSWTVPPDEVETLDVPAGTNIDLSATRMWYNITFDLFAERDASGRWVASFPGLSHVAGYSIRDVVLPTNLILPPKIIDDAAKIGVDLRPSRVKEDRVKDSALGKAVQLPAADDVPKVPLTPPKPPSLDFKAMPRAFAVPSFAQLAKYSLTNLLGSEGYFWVRCVFPDNANVDDPASQLYGIPGAELLREAARRFDLSRVDRLTNHQKGAAANSMETRAWAVLHDILTLGMFYYCPSLGIVASTPLTPTEVIGSYGLNADFVLFQVRSVGFAARFPFANKCLLPSQTVSSSFLTC
jgi:hypothetical protein